MTDQTDIIAKLLKETEGFSAEKLISYLGDYFSADITFASSLGEEDQVITHMIAKEAVHIPVFTLDTGRLFEETYQLIAKTKARYPISFKVYYPNTQSVENMVEKKGINLFYESIENRKLCCGVRKIEPLTRALQGKKAWITGLRKAQSLTRTTIDRIGFDESNQLIKVNPLADWSLDQVHEYIKMHNIDINPLHDKGFISIGCSSCTRAVKPGEDIRAGRWWWEKPEQKECGLHNNPNRPK